MLDVEVEAKEGSSAGSSFVQTQLSPLLSLSALSTDSTSGSASSSLAGLDLFLGLGLLSLVSSCLSAETESEKSTEVARRLNGGFVSRGSGEEGFEGDKR